MLLTSAFVLASQGSILISRSAGDRMELVEHTQNRIRVIYKQTLNRQSVAGDPMQWHNENLKMSFAFSLGHSQSSIATINLLKTVPGKSPGSTSGWVSLADLISLRADGSVMQSRNVSLNWTYSHFLGQSSSGKAMLIRKSENGVFELTSGGSWKYVPQRMLPKTFNKAMSLAKIKVSFQKYLPHSYDSEIYEPTIAWSKYWTDITFPVNRSVVPMSEFSVDDQVSVLHIGSLLIGRWGNTEFKLVKPGSEKFRFIQPLHRPWVLYSIKNKGSTDLSHRQPWPDVYSTLYQVNLSTGEEKLVGEGFYGLECR